MAAKSRFGSAWLVMPWLLQLVSAWPHCWSRGGRHELHKHDDELLAGVEQARRSAGAEDSGTSSMTEQEIEQARADVDQLDIEQLRCGVMLQLLHIEAVKKERDALMQAAKIALEVMDWMPTSKGVDVLWHRQQAAIEALKKAGVQ
jgi:hypothetical protein